MPIALLAAVVLGQAPEISMNNDELVGGTSSLKDSVPAAGEEVAVIETRHGKIVLRFFNDKAPLHVKNFKELAAKGFYDNTLFHRVIPGFMIQGGDPNTKDHANRSRHGMGGPGHNVKAEFNDVSHVRGILSMARAQDPDSAGSQFFVVQKAAPFLDKNYTVFGQVVKMGTEREGEESTCLAVVDRIVNEARDGNDNPREAVSMTVKIVKWPISD
jgi:cyclophilin family peptidyl-prolyl cis-trans isomerase